MNLGGNCRWVPLPIVASLNYFQFGTAVDIVFLVETVLEKPWSFSTSQLYCRIDLSYAKLFI